MTVQLKATLDALAERLTEPVVRLDAHRRIVFANAAFVRVFGTAPGSIAALAADDIAKASLIAALSAANEAELPLTDAQGELILVAIDSMRCGDGHVAVLRPQTTQASRATDYFLAAASHEMRTPLNAILGFSEVMKDQLFGPLGSDQYKGYVEDIHSSGEHLLALINEVLDLSRIEAGKHELVEDAIDFVATVDACVRMLELRAQSRGLTVKTAFTQGMMRLWADERAVRQVTLNLLANAIKFTPQGSEISIKVGWTASGGQYLSVKDNGPGIPEGEIETVLSTFGRGSQAIKNADQGSGLGLPIVKSLVELHGGAFVLRSKLREGTEAIAMFPPSRVMSAIAPVVEKTPEVVIVPTPKHGTSPRGRAA